MALADYAAYKAALLAPSQRQRFVKLGLTSIVGRYSSWWLAAPNAGVAPGGNAVPTNATAGALGQVDGGANRYGLARCNGRATDPAGCLLADRLVHTDGLSGTVTTAQTTNLPTTALTRYTSAVGVLAAIEIYTQIGATLTSFTCSYTNSAGTAGRTSPAYPIGSSIYNQFGRFLILPMQAGDVGVKSVESVTVLATTGTAGNFGVTLFKPLAVFCYPLSQTEPIYQDGLLSAGGMMPEIVDGACLFGIDLQGSNTAQTIHAEMALFEA
jgi:hypothetical protein